MDDSQGSSGKEISAPPTASPNAKEIEAAREIMKTFFTRWGYISSAAREQEELIAAALAEARMEGDKWFGLFTQADARAEKAEEERGVLKKYASDCEVQILDMEADLARVRDETLEEACTIINIYDKHGALAQLWLRGTLMKTIRALKLSANAESGDAAGGEKS
jgi:hypothetical protein